MSAHAPRRRLGQGFPTTRWSFVQDLGESNAEQRLNLLGAFFRRYQPALQAYLAHQFKGISDEDRDDLIQAFVLDKVICSELLEQAAESRGRFRNYLKTSLNNYAIDWLRRASTRQHRQYQRLEPWEQGAPKTADHVHCFEVVWAKQVIEDTVKRMREDLESRSRSHVWTVFERRFYDPAFQGIEPTAIEDLSEELNLDTRRVYNLLVTARRNFSRHLREVVSEYAATDEEIDAEIRDLMKYLQIEATSVFS